MDNHADPFSPKECRHGLYGNIAHADLLFLPVARTRVFACRALPNASAKAIGESVSLGSRSTIQRSLPSMRQAWTNVHKVAPVPCSKWRIAFNETPHLSASTCCDILACKRCEAMLAPINFNMSCLVPFTIATILFRVIEHTYYTITVLKKTLSAFLSTQRRLRIKRRGFPVRGRGAAGRGQTSRRAMPPRRRRRTDACTS